MRSRREPNPVHNTELRAWFNTKVGKNYRQAESRLLTKALRENFRTQVLQIGRLGWEEDYKDAIKFAHFSVVDRLPEAAPCFSSIQAQADALPIDSHSIDIVILPHLLEFEPDPHQVLREVNRVLKPEGILLLLGFNPWAIWHIPSHFPKMRDRTPWNGRFISRYRMVDWLNLLNFDIEHSQGCCLIPVLSSAHESAWRRRMFARIGACLPCLPGAYFVMGVKRVAGATPVGLSWKLKPRIVNPLTEPTTRCIHEPYTHTYLYRRRLPRKSRHRRLGGAADLEGS